MFVQGQRIWQLPLITLDKAFVQKVMGHEQEPDQVQLITALLPVFRCAVGKSACKVAPAAGSWATYLAMTQLGCKSFRRAAFL